jgi:undecaprenyl-diphosphatase
MTLTHALLLGLVQGVTEFLPVSSDGHLAIAQHFLTGFEQPGILFDVLLHVGTLFAILLYFRREVALLLASPFRRDEEARRYRRLLLLIAAGSLPTAVIGLAFKHAVTALYDEMTVVALMLLLNGALLFVAERFRHGSRKEEKLTLTDALLTGAAQGAAILPGLSRSGSTIAILLMKGVDGEAAVRFSFLMGLPAIAGAALLSLQDVDRLPSAEIPLYLAGIAVSFCVGIGCIHLLLRLVRRRRLCGFALYCWLAGGLLLASSL